MAYKIVFFDIDGTLINEEKEIPSDTRKAILSLQKKGIHVVIATGRSPFHLRRIREELQIKSFISYNGAYVEYAGTPIYQQELELAALEQLYALSQEGDHPLIFMGTQQAYTTHDSHGHIIETFNYLKMDFPEYDPFFYKRESVHQVLLYCLKENEQAYVGKFSEFDFIRWHKYSMDVLPKGGSKAKGIEAFLKHLGIAREDAVAFGDGLNDKEMLEFVGMGVAMGNAHPELKSLANWITKHVNEGGISYGLKELQLID